MPNNERMMRIISLQKEGLLKAQKKLINSRKPLVWHKKIWKKIRNIFKPIHITIFIKINKKRILKRYCL